MAAATCQSSRSGGRQIDHGRICREVRRAAVTTHRGRYPKIYNKAILARSIEFFRGVEDRLDTAAIAGFCSAVDKAVKASEGDIFPAVSSGVRRFRLIARRRHLTR